MGYHDEIWEAAKFLEEWDGKDGHGTLKYKLYVVPREAIDEESDEADAHLLHGIDSGNVRRVDVLIDTAYGRWDCEDIEDQVKAALVSAPKRAEEILLQYT